MDDVTGRTQLPPGLRGDAERPAPAEGLSASADDGNKAWRTLSGDAPLPEVAAAWLSLLTRRISRAVQAALFRVDNGVLAASPLAVWPQASVCDPTVFALAERAIIGRKPLMQRTAASADAVVAVAPVISNKDVVAVCAVSLLSSSDFEPVAAMRELQWALAWIEVALLRDRPRAEGAASDAVVARALSGIGHAATARNAALGFVNELASRFDCDRVTIGFRTGRHTWPYVISHSANVGTRTHLVRAIRTAMDEAIDQGAPAEFPAASGGMSVVTRAQGALAREGQSAGVLTVPFTTVKDKAGAITFERARGSLSAEDAASCVSAAQLAGPMLYLRYDAERPLSVRLWRGLLRTLYSIFGPHYLAAKLIVAALALAVAVTAIVQKDYRVTANATLEGMVRRTIAAPFDGYVAETFAKSGDVVRKDALLARLDDRDLQVEREKWRVEALKNRQKFVESLSENQRAEALAARAKLEQAEAQLTLVDSSLSRTRITAPFDGTVVSGDLSQSLGAAVGRGQVLFEMAPLGGYRIKLKVDERDIADVAVGQQGSLTLESFPTQALAFEIERVTLVSTAEEGINYYTVEAKLLDADTGELRPGMAGLGAIATVKRSIFWIYTHRLINTVRLWLWSL